MKKLLTILFIFTLVSCGIDVPQNTKVGYSNNDYTSHLFTNEIAVQDWNADENKENATYAVSEKEIKYINSVFKTIYDGITIGDVVTKLDNLYKTHSTVVQYYSSKRVGNTVQIVFTWDEGNVILTVPAVLSEDNSLKPLQVNSDVIKSSKNFAKNLGANSKETEDIINDVVESFFNPSFSIGEKDNISFKELDNELKILKENLEKTNWNKLYEKYATDIYHYKGMSYYSGNSGDEDIRFYSILSLIKDIKANELNITVQNIIDRFEDLTGLKPTEHFTMIGAQGFGNVLNIGYYDNNLKLTHNIEIVFNFISAGYGEIISLEEVSISYKTVEFKGKDIIQLLYKDSNQVSTSNIENTKPQKISTNKNNIKTIDGMSYYDGNFVKDVEESVKNRDEKANKALINSLYELSSNYIIFAHITESIDTLAVTFKEKYSSLGIQEVIKNDKNGQPIYIILAGKDVKNPAAFLIFNLKVENTANGQTIYANGENSIIFKAPTSETKFLDIDAIEALTR